MFSYSESAESPEELPLVQVDPADWVHLASGGRHVLFSYVGSPGTRWVGQALRLIMLRKRECGDEAHGDALAAQTWLMRDMIPVLANPSFVDVPQVFRIAPAAAEALSAQAFDKKQRPLKSPLLSSCVQVMPDYSAQKELVVELKPKLGCLHPPASLWVGGRNEQHWLGDVDALKRECSKYSMQQVLKMRRRKIHRITRYDPTDLFSGCVDRMRGAIVSLFDVPQNNLVLLRNGARIPPHDLNPGDQRAAVDAVIDGLQTSGVLAAILRAQTLTPIDATLAAKVPPSTRSIFYTAEPWPVGTASVSQAVLEGRAQPRNFEPTPPGGGPRAAPEHAVEREWGEVLRDFLRCRSAQDCSVMVSLTRDDKGVLRAEPGGVKVIDLDFKAPSSLAYWSKQDRVICQVFRRAVSHGLHAAADTHSDSSEGNTPRRRSLAGSIREGSFSLALARPHLQSPGRAPLSIATPSYSLQEREGSFAAASERDAAPQVLRVAAPRDTGCKGMYLALSVSANGAPVWGCGECRLFMSEEGKWTVSNRSGEVGSTCGVICANEVVTGKWPHEVSDWQVLEGDMWREATSATVSVSFLDITVRNAVPEDVEFLAWGVSAAERGHLPAGGPLEAALPKLNTEESLHFLRRALLAEADGRAVWKSFLIAEERGGRTVGCACAYPSEEDACSSLFSHLAFALVAEGRAADAATLKRVRERMSAVLNPPPLSQPSWCLEFVAVEDSSRGRGVAAHLLAHALQEGRRRGFKVSEVSCIESNSRAVSLYEAAGFEEHVTVSSPGWREHVSGAGGVVHMRYRGS
eukprot:Hpha_TRINITY_DN2031_c0_g1::TRINITY_DN2031_c0_g1_i1::g.83068::m.83068